MREDMAKVIVERPRVGGGYSYPRARARRWRQRDAEDLPRRQGIRRPWTERGTYKTLNENLAPLRRFLRSNVGRPWDKVFSEICEHLNINSAVQLHIWQHLKDDVCTSATRIGRTYLDPCGKKIFEELVVDARTGILRENKDRARWPDYRETWSPPIEVIKVDERHCYARLSEIWYEVELAPLPESCEGVFDIALKCDVRELRPYRFASLYGAEAYAVRKRQLNSKEIRRLPTPAS